MKTFKKLMKETYTDKDFDRVMQKHKQAVQAHLKGKDAAYVDGLESIIKAAGETSPLTTRDLVDLMDKALSPEADTAADLFKQTGPGDKKGDDDLPMADPKDVKDAPPMSLKKAAEPAKPGEKPGDDERFHSLAKRQADKGKKPDDKKEPGKPKSRLPEPDFLTVPSDRDVHGPPDLDWPSLSKSIRGTSPEPPPLPGAKPGSQAALSGEPEFDLDAMPKLQKALGKKPPKFDTDTMKKLKKGLAGKPELPKKQGLSFDAGSPYLDPKTAKRADKKGFLPTLKNLIGKK
jgi:hypothetical protein